MTSQFRTRLRALLDRKRMEHDLDDEMRFHLERQIETNIAQGMTPEQARLAALRQFGGVEQMKENCRDERGVSWLESLWFDLRYSVRMLRRTPGFSFAVVLVLALGIGANAAIFSLVDAVLFRPLPVAHSDELVQIYIDSRTGSRGASPELSPVSFPYFRALIQQEHGLAEIAGFMPGRPVNLSIDGGAPQRTRATLVSGNFFNVVGVTPQLGRAITWDDDRNAEQPGVAVISDQLWRREFAADAGVLGKPFRLNGQDFTVVGVAPAGFRGISVGRSADLFVPTASMVKVSPELRAFDPLNRKGLTWLQLIGRNGRQLPLEQVSARLNTASKHVATALGDELAISLLPLPLNAVAADPLQTGEARRLSLLLLGVVGLVLLIAAADIAGLMLVRSERREREVAVRMAIGAAPWRVLRQLLCESLLLSFAGGAAALLVAQWFTSTIAAIAPATFPLPVGEATPVLAGRVLLFTLFAVLLTALLAGLLPAVRAMRTDLLTALKRQIALRRVGGSRVPLANGFIALQLSLSVVLLVGASLLLHTLWNVYHVQPGFETTNRVSTVLEIGRQGYTRESGPQFYQQVLDKVRALPGVRAAALSSHVPIEPSGMQGTIDPQGYQPAKGEEPIASLTIATPDFVKTMGLRLVAGREFTAQDTANGAPVVMVNETLARKYWPGENPVGKRIMNFGESGAEVVGVVADHKYDSLRTDPPVVVYTPLAQFYSAGMALVLHTDTDANAFIPSLKAALAQLDKELPLFDLQTLDQQMAASVAQERIVAGLLGGFAALALLLAATGVFSVMAYSTETRRQEFGIRMALGAQRSDVLWNVLRGATQIAVVGLVVGLAAAFAMRKTIEPFLFGVTPGNPLAYAAVALILLVMALAAGFIPARRATKVDPAMTLRAE